MTTEIRSTTGPDDASAAPGPDPWLEARLRAEAYLEALGYPSHERVGLAAAALTRARAGSPTAGPPLVRALAALREHLLEQGAGQSPAADPAEAFERWRLVRWLGGAVPGQQARPRAPGLRRGGALASAPELVRRSMLPSREERRAGSASQPPPAWLVSARRRSFGLALLVSIPAVIGTGFMLELLLSARGPLPLDVVLALLFGALLGWISVGFWTALVGFLVLLRRAPRFGAVPGAGRRAAASVRTAIVMPICNEPVERTFAGLRAMHESLARQHALADFDFFVLSDSSDPGAWVREEEAWASWCRDASAFDRIHYRHRRAAVARKSGNVADFCRRYGACYRYMVVLDADSLMTGEALLELVDRMERDPDTALIQTAPSQVNRVSLFGRLQQFSSRLYGPVFAAGLHYWQLGHGNYWGHNAIVRIAPFMAHCALPTLTGRPPFGGEILSHDFVEAALLGRAGYSLWLAYDLPGSYEEPPSTLLEEMQRDRRWCQGNLQHLRLLRTRGLRGAHRVLFLSGVMSYVSALLWLAFLGVSSALALWNAVREPDYFPSGRSLFPDWPVWHPDWAAWLLVTTATILFLPKLLGLGLALARGDASAFGGRSRLLASAALELVFSSLLAPVRMAFHSRFVLLNLLGREVAWRSQQREDRETGWREALRHHGLDSALACLWAASLWWLDPDSLGWLAPVVAALALSAPLSVLASRVSLGRRTRAAGLLLTPEEMRPPRLLLDLRRELGEARRAERRRPVAERDGFVRAVVDPYVNALHGRLLGRPRRLSPGGHADRRALFDRALAQGPEALDREQRRALLVDPLLLRTLHEAVWALPDPGRARAWGRPAATGTPDPGADQAGD